MNNPLSNGTHVVIDGNADDRRVVVAQHGDIVTCRPDMSDNDPNHERFFPRHRVETIDEFNRRIKEEEDADEAARKPLPPLYPG